MKPISKITLAVEQLAARPEGCSTREVMDHCSGQRKAVQACVQRFRDNGLAVSRSGIDGGGIRCSRYFLTKAAADAYVFQPGYYDKRSEWKNSASAKYVHLVAENPAITYADVTVLMGLTAEGATKTLGRLIKAGHLFAARKMSEFKRRPVSVLFSSEQLRDEWQAANPLQKLRHAPGWRGEPKLKPTNPPKVKAAKPPKAAKPQKQRSVSIVRSNIGRQADMLSRLNRMNFGAEPKPKGSNAPIPHEAAQKVTVREGYPDHRFWVDPASVPRFSYGSAVAA